jgi:1,4-alpha-glucan branching enzyme
MTGSKPDEDIRLPMQWSNSSNAGFTTGDPWRAPKSDYTSKNITDQQMDPSSLWRNYQHLIATRNSQIALRQGNYRAIQSNANSVFTCLRQFEAENIIIVSNPTSAEKTDLTLNLSTSGIEPGSYELIDLKTGIQQNITVNSSGDIIDQSINSIPAQTTRIYKLLTGTAIFTSIDLMVDMNGLISNQAFDPQTETVKLISNQNSLGTQEIDLTDSDSDGIYEVTLSDIIIGSDLEYKYGINEINNGREEFTDTDFMRTFKLKEGENQVLDFYNQIGKVLATDNESLAKHDFIIYPNPANDQLNIILQTGNTNSTDYKIIDISGRMKVSGSLNDTNSQINISSMANGLYFIQLTIGKEIVTQKFMLNR